jgi:hypothetical protein
MLRSKTLWATRHGDGYLLNEPSGDHAVAATLLGGKVISNFGQSARIRPRPSGEASVIQSSLLELDGPRPAAE